MKGREQNLTNAQFPILNSHPTQNLAMYARGLSPRMRIENWELSIGQIDDHVPDIMRSCMVLLFGSLQGASSFKICKWHVQDG